MRAFLNGLTVRGEGAVPALPQPRMEPSMAAKTAKTGAFLPRINPGGIAAGNCEAYQRAAA